MSGRAAGTDPVGRPRLGVIGAGWWATDAHLPSLREHPGADLVAICDSNAERTHAAALAFDVPHVFTDVTEMTSSGLLDAVIVATPHATHHAIASRALRAGLHVMVEKTLTVTAADAWELVTLAESRGLHLSVGYTYQHTSTADAVRMALQTGQIGDVVQVVAEFSSGTERLFTAAEQGTRTEKGPADPATYSATSGGGQAHTQLTHVMGCLFWALDRQAQEVFAYMDHRGLAVDVVDAATFRLDGGGLGVAASTGTLALEVPARHRLVFHGTAGMIEQDLLAATAKVHTAAGTRRHAVAPHEPAYPVRQPARAFAELVAGRGPNRSPGRSGAAAVAFLEAAHASATGGRPQSVQQAPEEPR